MATYKPFATRNQFMEWASRNCGACKKGWEERHLRFRCDWERALYVAAVDNGKVTEEVARAIGYLDNFAPGWTDPGCYIWECSAWERR